MTMTTCPECHADISDSATACPRCGAVRKPATSAAAKEKKSVWPWIFGIPIGLFLLMLIIGASVSDKDAQRMAGERNLAEKCDEMIADSALGSERRMTRAICDQAKELARQRK